MLRLGLAVDNVPHIIPLNYGYTMEEGKLTFYLHSAVKGNKLDLLRQNPNVCFELDCDYRPFEGVLPCQYGLATPPSPAGAGLSSWRMSRRRWRPCPF